MALMDNQAHWMSEEISVFRQVFTIAFLVIAALSFLSGGVSWRGTTWPLIATPKMIRIRYFAFGLFVALLHQHYDWGNTGWFGFITAALLVIAAIRTRVTEEPR